jgi:LPS sulfotransferase NodH
MRAGEFLTEMLDNYDTGYEGKFDFPPRAQAPEHSYLLASVPRAGSTFLSHALWQTGCLGAPLEYLNFERLGPYGFANGSATLQLELWHSVLRRRCSQNGVFGLKAFAMQLDQLQRSNPPLLSEVLATVLPSNRPRRIVYLRRRDRHAQVVSYARASLSGVWTKAQEKEAVPLTYSQDALDAAERGIALQETVWGRMFKDLRINPLELWHEDTLADADRACRLVADYVGVAINPEARVEIPGIARYSESRR